MKRLVERIPDWPEHREQGDKGTMAMPRLVVRALPRVAERLNLGRTLSRPSSLFPAWHEASLEPATLAGLMAAVGTIDGVYIAKCRGNPQLTPRISDDFDFIAPEALKRDGREVRGDVGYRASSKAP